MTQRQQRVSAVPGQLLNFIGASKFARDVLAGIESDGYVVLPGILTEAEVEVEYSRMWKWVETVAPGVRRRSPKSWRRQGGADPWPCSQRDMMQLHQAGWVFNDLRELMAERVFEKLYGTHELHCSKDGFTLQRPTLRELNRSPNDHFDQGSSKYGLQCIQGSVALTDQEFDDGCFLCWPGSHNHHSKIVAERGAKAGRQDFVILNEREKEYLRSHGIEARRVPVRRGDVILFRSDLAHCGASPIGCRENFRAVVYVCMLPAAMTPELVYQDKKLAYEQLETGSHWPNREEWFAQRREPDFTPCPFFTKPPALSARQRLLYGLDRYGTQAVVQPKLDAVESKQSVEIDTAATPARTASRNVAKTRRWGTHRDQQTEQKAEADKRVGVGHEPTIAPMMIPGSEVVTPSVVQEPWASEVGARAFQFATHDEEILTYYTVGQEGCSPVFLLHGFRNHSQCWFNIGPAKRYSCSLAVDLARAGYFVVAMDLRGHGRSAKPVDPAKYTKEQELYDILALADHRKLHRFAVVGYSHGSIEAAKLVAISQRVRCAVLGGIGDKLASRQWHTEYAVNRLAMSLEKQGGHRQLAFAGVQRGQSVTSPEELSQICVPVLCINGYNDDENGSKEGLAKLIPNAQLSWVKGDHATAVNDPQYCHEITEFLSEHYPVGEKLIPSRHKNKGDLVSVTIEQNRMHAFVTANATATASMTSMVTVSDSAFPFSDTREPSKEARKLKKALREIEVLEQRLGSGETLRQNQLQKLQKKADYSDKLQRLID